MFKIVCAVRLSARDTFEEAQVEAQYNWEQFGLKSAIRRDGNLVAIHDGNLHPIVQRLAA